MNKKKYFFIVWLLALVGGLSIIPYVLAMNVLPPTISIPKMVLLGMGQLALIFGLICWLSYIILPKTDLRPFVATHPLKRIVYPGIFWGISVGLVIFFTNKWVFGNSLLVDLHPPLWTGALASFYGAFNEEISLRLFLFSLLYFILHKCCKISVRKKSQALWGVNIVVALIFGLGHLPLAFKVMIPSAVEIFRIIFLNAIGGVVFGWLYWTRSLWTAMAAHFVADLMIHVFFA